MSSELESTIKSIRKKISEKRPPFSSDRVKERDIVDNIIRPILGDLGWGRGDSAILNESEVELRKKKGRADLVLSKGLEGYVIAVEVKRLDAKIDGSTDASEKFLDQLINYLISLNREFGILTNGVYWHLIRRNGFDWETIWMKNILTDKMPDVLDALMYIHPDNSEELSKRVEIDKRKVQVLGKEWVKIQQDRDLQLKMFVDLLKKQVESRHSDLKFSSAEVMEFLKEKYSGIDLDETPIPKNGGGTYTFSLEGKLHSLKRMKEALVITAEWLISRGDLHTGTIPIESGKSRYLISETPMHRNNRNFDSAVKLSNGFYLETNYSSIDYKRKVWELLEHFKQKRSLVVFSW